MDVFIPYEWDSKGHYLKEVLTCTPGSTGLGFGTDRNLQLHRLTTVLLSLCWEHSEQQWCCSGQGKGEGHKSVHILPASSSEPEHSTLFPILCKAVQSPALCLLLC